MTGRVFLALLLPLLAGGTSDPRLLRPRDCTEILGHKVSGVYTVYPSGDTPVEVYCEMGCDGDLLLKRWTVIQRRMDGSVNFYRPWAEYKHGFGNKYGEHWLGLESLYQLTRWRKYELRVDMEDFGGGQVYALYSFFSVESETNGYKLHVGGFTNGGAGDSLRKHNGQKFSTFDKDQDPVTRNCAKAYLGGFWYNDCHHANPNGIYLRGLDKTYYGIGNCWYHYRGHEYGLKYISMKIRPLSE